MRTRRLLRPGYTLFELILVLAILVLMAAIVYPSFQSMYEGFKLGEATDKVRGGWASARTYAVNDSRSYRFSVVPGKGNFRVAPDAAEFWSGAEVAANGEGLPFGLEDALPKGIRFTIGDNAVDATGESTLPAGSVDASQYQTVVIFLADGSARADVEILLHSTSTRAVSMRLRALTGAVSAKTLDPGQ